MNTTGSVEKKTILLTFDVEDWFQVENFKEYIPFSTWDNRELRVEKNTHLILDFLDSFNFKPKATFFILGWIAQKVPQLVREINNRGHEVANHGNHHHLCTKLNFREIADDLNTGKKILEDIISNPVNGYRAPSFAINDDILKIIRDTGHIYDSSYNSFAVHGRYGKISLPMNSKYFSLIELSDNFYELPISNLILKKTIFPLGGGGYFRLIPFPFFKLGMKKVISCHNTFVFYSHPWEFDPDQPVVNEANSLFKFRHYINLNKTKEKLQALVDSFQDYNFITCFQLVARLKYNTVQ